MEDLAATPSSGSDPATARPDLRRERGRLGLSEREGRALNYKNWRNRAWPKILRNAKLSPVAGDAQKVFREPSRRCCGLLAREFTHARRYNTPAPARALGMGASLAAAAAPPDACLPRRPRVRALRAAASRLARADR